MTIYMFLGCILDVYDGLFIFIFNLPSSLLRIPAMQQRRGSILTRLPGDHHIIPIPRGQVLQRTLRSRPLRSRRRQVKAGLGLELSKKR